MGQREVINYLIKNQNDWITRDELIRVTNTSIDSMKITLRTLVQAGEIERRYERVDNPNRPGTKHVITWVKLTNHYKNRLKEEGLL